MKAEPATILVIIVGGVTFFFLLLPLGVVLARLRAVWRADRGTGLLMSGVIVLTAFFFLLFFMGLVVIAFGGE